ncbi:MAG TPA: hypothetical protein VJ655_15815, partial [Caulobacter sp.]|nr:hypothetical protein [Caulobacter sp.]
MATVTPGLAALVCLVPGFDHRSSYLPFIVPVVISAGLGGAGPALLAALIGFFAGVAFQTSELETVGGALSAVTFVLAAGSVVF